MTVARGEMPYVVIARYIYMYVRTRIAYTYAHVSCAGSCDVYVQSTSVGLNGNRRGGPGSCFLKVRHYHTIRKAHHVRK